MLSCVSLRGVATAGPLVSPLYFFGLAERGKGGKTKRWSRARLLMRETLL